MESLNAVELRELGDGSRREPPQSSLGPQPTAGIENASFEDEDPGPRIRVTSRTSGPEFTAIDSQLNPLPIQRQVPSPHSEDEPEIEYNSHSVDYGFIFALVFLVSGIILVVIAYTIPREAKVNPDQVTARQMEKLEMYYAQLGSHLDKCIIAGLGLLTVGGMLLSILLMVSICKGELYRRRTFARRPMKSYGSINMRMRQLAEGDGRETLVECEPNAIADAANGNQVASGTLNT
ncbi:transmembrane protein 74B-like [Carassius carassius]|uniref:transmembrane protein 74B-like n=1 Tax=Carassius carassius TaxID=217509 RepID=UPI00286874DB|nr:transmembrane protein 74B-like [Carassius carassius]